MQSHEPSQPGWAPAPQSPPPASYPYSPSPYPGGYPGGPVPPVGPRPPRDLSPYGMPARHVWEIPLLVIVCLCTAVAYLVALLVVIARDNVSPYFLVIVAAPALILYGRGMLYSRQRVNGVRMSPTQFPDGYRMVHEAAARFGMAKVPEAYVVLGNGQINAFASGHGFRRFVVVYSDLFEIGGAAREPDALAFVIAHEVGHIAAGHTSYWRQLGMMAGQYIPFLGTSLSRAQEYTADNHGYAFRSAGAPGAMRTLAGGKYLNSVVRFDEFADRAAQERGFFVWLVNLMAGHPVLTWRSWALRDRARHGKMFWPPRRPSGAPSGGYPAYPAAPYPGPGGGTVGSTPGPAGPTPPRDDPQWRPSQSVVLE